MLWYVVIFDYNDGENNECAGRLQTIGPDTKVSEQEAWHEWLDCVKRLEKREQNEKISKRVTLNKIEGETEAEIKKKVEDGERGEIIRR